MAGRVLSGTPDPPSDEARHLPGLVVSVWAVGLVVEALGLWLDVRLGPWTTVGFEEGRNARAALQLACGHTDALSALQYRDFCGGCTGVALLGAPVLQLAGPTVGAWKLVPAGLHLWMGGALAAVAGVGPGSARRRALAVAAAWGLLWATPWALRDLALTGWGNHAESRALTWLAVAVLAAGSRRGSGLLGGILTGLSIWFAHISMHAVPALAVLALRGQRGRGAAWALGTGLGLLPWAAYLRAQPSAQAGAAAMWGTGALASLADGARFFLEPLRPGVLWPSTQNTAIDAFLAGFVWLAAGVAAAGVLWSRRETPKPALAVGLCVLGYLAAVMVRADLWADVPALSGYSPFHLRYRVVLWPPLVVGAALAVRHRPRVGLALLPLCVVGLVGRGVAWSGGPAPLWSAALGGVPGRPDATVPEGQPERRRPWGLDRPQDVAAAAAFVAAHTDAWDACRADHIGEWGRRAALLARRGQVPELPSPDTLTALDRHALSHGLAWGTSQSGPTASLAHLPPAWQAPTLVALYSQPDADPSTLPHSDAGICARAARVAWETATKEGRHRPAAPAPSECADWDAALSAAVPCGVQALSRWPDGQCP